MTEIELTFRNWLTPSGNQLSGYHWRRRHRMKRDWQWLVLAAMGSAGVGEQLGRFHVTVERHAARPIKDLDNVIAGLKPVLDGMVAAGLLVDDSSDYVVSLEVVQVKCPKVAQRTIIRLRPAATTPPGSSCST
jgi:Holliday junction resolvase RusA-like endonuclease